MKCSSPSKIELRNMIKPVDATTSYRKWKGGGNALNTRGCNQQNRHWEMPQGKPGFVNQYIAKENKEMEKEPVD